MTEFKKYIFKVCIAISILFNVILLGSLNQTFSARNYIWKKKSKRNFVYIIDLILGTDHCMDSWIKWTIMKGKLESYDQTTKVYTEKITRKWDY